MTDLASDPRVWRAIKAPSLADLEILAAEVFRRLPRRFRDLCADIRQGQLLATDPLPHKGPTLTQAVVATGKRK